MKTLWGWSQLDQNIDFHLLCNPYVWLVYFQLDGLEASPTEGKRWMQSRKFAKEHPSPSLLWHYWEPNVGVSCCPFLILPTGMVQDNAVFGVCCKAMTSIVWVATAVNLHWVIETVVKNLADWLYLIQIRFISFQSSLLSSLWNFGGSWPDAKASTAPSHPQISHGVHGKGFQNALLAKLFITMLGTNTLRHHRFKTESLSLWFSALWSTFRLSLGLLPLIALPDLGKPRCTISMVSIDSLLRKLSTLKSFRMAFTGYLLPEKFVLVVLLVIWTNLLELTEAKAVRQSKCPGHPAMSHLTRHPCLDEAWREFFAGNVATTFASDDAEDASLKYHP